MASEMESPFLRQASQSPRVHDNPYHHDLSNEEHQENIAEFASIGNRTFIESDSPSRHASSRHSSVSSFPASVVHHVPVYERSVTPSNSPFNHGFTTRANQSPRPHSTGFRHPSSVRAMQMRDEFESTDCDDYIAPSHRRRHSKTSYLSYRSSGSHQISPAKYIRASRSAQSSPSKTKLKREFPLVLLHCTLLPPTLNARASLLGSEAGDKDSVLEAIIPEPYVKRWKVLQEKLVRNAEVRTRGVLIPHPQEDYELLEERLLESLELERPRIRGGHYLAPQDDMSSSVDSGFESGSTDTDSRLGDEKDTLHLEDATQNHCPDCGHGLGVGVEEERKWEVKVFAANGLMRAGAWTAAWSEMEKVDVEVSIWMPPEIRREVNERLEALITKELEEQSRREKICSGMDDERAKEIYGEGVRSKDSIERSQAEIDGLADTPQRMARHTGTPIAPPAMIKPQQPINTGMGYTSSSIQKQPQPDLATIISIYIQLFTQDRRNIAIVLLSMLVVFYGLSNNVSSTVKTEINGNNGTDAGSILSSIAVHTVISTTTSVMTSVSMVTAAAESAGLEIHTDVPIMATTSMTHDTSFSKEPDVEAAYEVIKHDTADSGLAAQDSFEVSMQNKMFEATEDDSVDKIRGSASDEPESLFMNEEEVTIGINETKPGEKDKEVGTETEDTTIQIPTEVILEMGAEEEDDEEEAKEEADQTSASHVEL